MILVDTSVIADIFTKDKDWFEWSSKQIERWAEQGPVCYDTIIFGELAVKFDTQKELEHRLSAFTYLPLRSMRHFKQEKLSRNTDAPAAQKRVRCRTFLSARMLTWRIYRCSPVIPAVSAHSSHPFDS